MRTSARIAEYSSVADLARRAVRLEDRATRRHSRRVAALAHALALQSGWGPGAARELARAAVLHDVGKVRVPAELLAKPGPLSAAEQARVRAHAVLGAEIVAGLLGPEGAAWVRHHHERWDGAGYPDGLAGRDIPEGARLIAVADAWDAMTSHRPYRAALEPAAAAAELASLSGVQFCPDAVGALRVVLAHGPPRAAPLRAAAG